METDNQSPVNNIDDAADQSGLPVDGVEQLDKITNAASSRLDGSEQDDASPLSDGRTKSAAKLVANWLGTVSDLEGSAPAKKTKSRLTTQDPSDSKQTTTGGKHVPASIRRKSLKRTHRTPVPNIKPIISITPVPSSPVHRSSPSLGVVNDGAWDLSSGAGVCMKMPSTGPLDFQTLSRTKALVDVFREQSSSPCQVAPIALTKKTCDTPAILDLVTNGKAQEQFGHSSENDSQSGDSSDASVGSEISEISSKNDYESDADKISRSEVKMDTSIRDKNLSRLIARKQDFQQIHRSMNPLNNLELMSSIALALDMSASVTVTPVQSTQSPPLSSPLNLSMKRPQIHDKPAPAHSSPSTYTTVNRGAKRGPKPKYMRGLSALTEEENQLRLRQASLEELKIQLETQLMQQQFQLKLAQKAALYDRRDNAISPSEIHTQTTSTSGRSGKHCFVTKNASSVSGTSARSHLSPSLLALSQGLSSRSVSLLPNDPASTFFSSSHSKAGLFGHSKNSNGILSLFPVESHQSSRDAGFGSNNKTSSKLKSFTSKTSSEDDDSSGILGSSGSNSMDTTSTGSGSSDNDSDSSSSGTETSSGRGQKREYSSEGSSPTKKSRKLVNSDERELRIPLEHGWRRLTKIRMYSFSGARGEVVYFAPCGKKLKTYPEVVRYLEKNGINDIGRENFSFSAKHNVGEYLEPQGNGEYAEIMESEVVARIEEFRARKGRRYIPVALRRKLEEKHRRREESRQRRRLEQQGKVADYRKGQDLTTRKKRVREKSSSFSAREAKYVKAVEARLQKEHVRFLRQQEKFEKQEQLRLEREVKAHHALEARKKRQELLEKQRIEETEREMKRLQAVVLREQELQKRREMLIMVDLERERRRQHMLLVKALETRKRQEERERMKEERLEEKKLIRERKMEERKLELHLLREMRKPVDDMELKDSKPLPVFSRVPGIKLAGQAFADIMMVYEFLNNFGETLGFDMDSLPSLNTFQTALLNDYSYEEEILSVLHHLLTCAIEDPGIPGGPKGKTALNQHLKDVDITCNTVSEVLRIFIQATEGCASKYFEWLNDKPFMALTATQKASILAHLCNELLCSRVICRQIDNNIEIINNMRRDKWMIEGKVRKLKMVHAKKVARQQLKGHVGGNKTSENDGNVKKSEKNTDEDVRNENSDNEHSDGSQHTGHQEVEEPEEEPGVTIEDLGKKIEKMTKQQNLCRRKLIRTTHQLRVSSLGQDRYRRRYWILPTVGGVYVESLESSELSDDQPRATIAAAEAVVSLGDQQSVLKVKGEVLHECDVNVEEKNNVREDTADEKNESEPPLIEEESKEGIKDEKNVTMEDIGKSDVNLLTPDVKTASADDMNFTETLLNNKVEDKLFEIPRSGLETHQSPSLVEATVSSHFNHYFYPGLFPVPQCQISAEQILKTFGNKSPEDKPWFSILPRMPCDETSLTRLQQSTNEKSVNLEPKIKDRKCVTPSQSSTVSRYPLNQFSPFYFQDSLAPSPFSAGSASMTMFNGGLSPFLISNLYGASPAVTSSDADASIGNSPSPYIWSPALMQQYAALRDLQQQQYPEPQPISNDFRRGWWRITDAGQLKAVIQALHARGIREKMLQIKLQKYVDVVGDACNKGGQICSGLLANNDDGDDLQNAPAPDDDASWNRDVVRRLEVAVLEQVESLEEKVTGASMQLKQWKLPPKLTEEDGVHFYVMGEEPLQTTDEESNGLSSKVDDALENSPCSYSALKLAKERLLALEAAIERRYMKPPLGNIVNDVNFSSMHHQHNHSRSTVQTNGTDVNVDVASDVPVHIEEEEEESPPSPVVEEASKGLLTWRTAVRNARTSSQLAVCLNYLEGSIAWDRSIMKASCQFCNSGDNEAMLLLCDGCDKGYHTYCFKPKMESIPDGDWFCYECLNKATGNRLCLFCGKKGKNLCLCDVCPKAYHIDCLDPPLARVPKTKWHCPQCNNNNGGKSTPKHTKTTKTRKSPKEKKEQDSDNDENVKKQEQRASSSKVDRMQKDRNKNHQNNVNSDSEDMSSCKELLAGLEAHADAWPFLLPVNTKQFPSYKKVIRRPMDMSTVHNKLDNGVYKTRTEFAADVRLVFNNCETFNEDDSPVGKAGHNLRAHFETLWNDVSADK